uniref:Ankyrin repeat domain-containing protein n=1 Tax=Oryza meridionalis TaxID=40149 RepID=A0A0E0BXX2_9ORYZ
MAAPFVRPPPDRRRHRCESSPGGLGVGAAFDGNLRRLQGEDIIKSLDVGKGKTRDAVLALSKDGIRLLHAAACQGHLTVCKFLMKELGGDINIAGAEGCCKAGADVNGKGTVTGAIPNIPDGQTYKATRYRYERNREFRDLGPSQRGSAIPSLGSHPA